MFSFDRFISERATDSPATLMTAWLQASWAIARVAVPVLFLGAVVGAAIVDLLPAATNDVPGVAVAAAFGTLLMIPTWTEIAMAGPLIREGFHGPAAALLLTLPAVSMPSLVIIGAMFHDYRVAVLLALGVFLAGALAGLAFL